MSHNSGTILSCSLRWGISIIRDSSEYIGVVHAAAGVIGHADSNSVAYISRMQYIKYMVYGRYILQPADSGIASQHPSPVKHNQAQFTSFHENNFALVFGMPPLLLIFAVALTILYYTWAFQPHASSFRVKNQQYLSMKWSFGKGYSTLKDLGVIGAEGEYYYHPQNPAKLSCPPEMLGKQIVIPIFPYNHVLVPGSQDWLNVLEMRSRQMLNEVGDGNVFGITYYSQQLHKIALVGTLVRIKSRQILEDGRVLVVIEGTERFHLERMIADRPYIKAKVRIFKDGTEVSDATLDQLEQSAFEAARCNFKFMKLLYPQKNFTLSSNILHNRPRVIDPRHKIVKLVTESEELSRRSKFSFAVIDMLQISNPMRLALLQEHFLERKLRKILTILEKGDNFLRTELLKTGEITESDLQQIQESVALDPECWDILPKLNRAPENYVDGQWIQGPTFFDEQF